MGHLLLQRNGCLELVFITISIYLLPIEGATHQCIDLIAWLEPTTSKLHTIPNCMFVAQSCTCSYLVCGIANQNEVSVVCEFPHTVVLALSPGHSQILSRSCGEKSGEGLVPILRRETAVITLMFPIIALSFKGDNCLIVKSLTKCMDLCTQNTCS